MRPVALLYDTSSVTLVLLNAYSGLSVKYSVLLTVAILKFFFLFIKVTSRDFPVSLSRPLYCIAKPTSRTTKYLTISCDLSKSDYFPSWK